MSTLTIKHYYDEAQALKDIRTYHPDLNIDFLRQAGLFAHYGNLLAKAETQYDRLCHALERSEAKLYRDTKADALASGKKMTDSEAKSIVESDDRIYGGKLVIVEAREQVMQLKAMCEAFRQRKDMLMQLGMTAREELKGGPALMANTNKENRHVRLKSASDANFGFEDEQS
jgi:hypothetical protein